MSAEPLHLRSHQLAPLRAVFGDRLQPDVPLAPFTSARIGGPADWFLEVRSADELAQAVCLLWEADLPYFVLGGGSNLLISDAGVRGVVLLNRARRIRFHPAANPPAVWAESGASLGQLARRAALKGLSGLEWAVGIPGTLGGAVYGNAGAHGSDIAASLLVAEILHRIESPRRGGWAREEWQVDRLEYAYRSSLLKRQPGMAVVLSARLALAPSTTQAVRQRSAEWTAYRRKTQPPGASMGSMFKNPPGDYAGRLVEAAGLKGRQVGAAQISPLHANFFLNLGGASASDVYALIRLAQQAVADQFGIRLELEVELVGEW